jgi:hypothetical protein
VSFTEVAFRRGRKQTRKKEEMNSLAVKIILLVCCVGGVMSSAFSPKHVSALNLLKNSTKLPKDNCGVSEMFLN